MGWNFVLQVTECGTGEPVPGATIHLKAYYRYEEQEPAVSVTTSAERDGRRFIEVPDHVHGVQMLIGQYGYRAELKRVEPEQTGQVIAVCLQKAQARSDTRPPEALRVVGWGDNHVDLEWWNPEAYRKVLVGWTNVTEHPGSHNQLEDLPGSTTKASIRTRFVRGYTYDLKVKGYSSAHGYSPWTNLRWVCPPLSQTEWRYCAKCQALFYNGFPKKGRCPAGGGHDKGRSFDYALAFGDAPTAKSQRDWRYCAKCQALFYNGFPKKGRCPAGGEHDAGRSFDYVLAYG